MQLYFYAPKVTQGLPDLMSAMDATRLSRHDGLNFLVKGKVFIPEPGSVIICWGYRIPSIPGITVINASVRFVNDADLNKYLYKQPKYFLAPEWAEYSTIAAYWKSLEQCANGRDANGVYPTRHIPGTYTNALTHAFRSRVHVFGTELFGAKRLRTGEEPAACRLPTGKLAERIANVFADTQLQFGEITIFRTGTNSERNILHKIITAPKLDTELVGIYAKQLDLLIKTPTVVIEPTLEVEGD